MTKSRKVWDLNRARELNDREPPPNLIRSGCARVLVTDLILLCARCRRRVVRSPKPLPRCARHARTCDTCRYVLPNEGPDAGVAVESEKRAYLDSVKTD